MAISNNTYLDYDGLKVYTQALLGKFALLAKTPELDSNGIIKSQYLPSYVDDVVEYANRAAFPSEGDKSKLYLAQDTGDIYRWTGTQYVNMLSADGIAAQAAKVTNALKFGSKSYDGSVAQTITKADLGLGNVENVALSTWKGSTNITTLGVITTGTWQGTKIANAYLANSSITIGTTKFNLGDAKTAIEGLTSLLFSGASGALTYNKTDKYYSLADNLVVNGILASGTSGTGGAGGYSQVEWADIQKMTGSVSGSLASAYAVKESYSALNTIVSKKADKITLDAVTTRVTSLENKYTAVTTDIANHIGNTTVHITSAERTAWNNKQAAISDLATIRSNAATAYGWGDHSEAGYITGITKAMVESVLTGNITSHTHTFASLTSKPTTLSGYGITDASRIFRYTIPASGNKGVRITFTSYEPVKITVSGSNQGAQLVLVGTGYGNGGFVRNNFTEVVPSNEAYSWCVSNDSACSVEIFSKRADRDFVIVESPSHITFTAISALSTDAAYRHLLTTANYSSYALPLTGGTISGEVSFAPGAHLTLLGPDNIKHSLGVFSSYPDNLLHWNSTAGWQRIWDSGNSNKIDVNWTCDMMTSMNIGSLHTAVFDANNPDRWINSDYGSANRNFSNMPEGWSFGTVLTIGLQGYKGDLNAQFVWDVQHYGDINNPGRLWWRTKNAPIGWKNWKEIYHSGNCNLSTIPWTCSSLTAANFVSAIRGRYGLIEFSNLDSSAGHGGYIDFHYNGSTADYTSRIIEDAASQLTLIASTVKATGDVKATGWCKATNGFLIEESGVYYTHHSQFGEIDIVKGNEFIWGSKTDTLYFNYRASANETTTVAHYIWNAGSPTTYATHTMGSLTVLGAITATTTIHATTGIYTDGYISAKQASTSSDRRLKTDFRSIDNALKYVLNTHYTRFRWKDDNKESIGIIAQEEQNREYGFLVQNRKEIGHLTYDYAASTALLGAAIQDEDSKVEKLRKRIIKLENELSNLKKKWQH